MRFNKNQVREAKEKAAKLAAAKARRWVRLKVLLALLVGFSGGVALMYYYPDTVDRLRIQMEGRVAQYWNQ
jgi:cell division septal protein FtsQ